MIFFSSDPSFSQFYEKFLSQDLKIDLLVTESPKKQGRKMETKPNPAHQFALNNHLEVRAFELLDEQALVEIKKFISDDELGFIFAYGKLIPENIINLFKNGILNIHFSVLPEYPGASPIQQALLDNKTETGYTVFKITKLLDQGKILVQKETPIHPNDNFDSLREKIIKEATEELPNIIKKYLDSEIELTEMPRITSKFTTRLKKEDGLITERDSAITAYNKIRAFSRWPKAYLVIDSRRFIIHEAHLEEGMLKIMQIQPEGKKPMSFKEFSNGNRTLLTKMPSFVNIN